MTGRTIPTDADWMAAALTLARRGLGRVAPNPAVGCVLVREGQVVGRGWTQPGGRPHAETEALGRAGAAAYGATAYITLEPCAHHGRTPPCVEALIAAGVRRCVVALRDPDPRVAGQGLDRLRAAGIEVVPDVGADVAAALNDGYLRHRREGRPAVTLKLATTLDGRIATRTGASQWITGEASRRRAHLLRAEHDAVMVGSGTALADNPRLSVRLPGLESCQPRRVVVDGRLRLPLTHDLVTQAQAVPTTLLTRPDPPHDRAAAYRNAGVDVRPVGLNAEGTLSLPAALAALGAAGLTRVLVEGGGTLAAGLMRADLLDTLIWFRAASVMGGDGIPAVAGFGVAELAAMPHFARVDSLALGPDIMDIHRRAA